MVTERIAKQLEPVCLWLLRKSGYWNRIPTIDSKSVRRLSTDDGELDHHRIVAYEAGRHELLWDLMHPK